MAPEGNRRYRQQGYQKDAGEKREKRAPSPRPPDTGAPRPSGMAPSRTVSRCGECGTQLTVLTEPLGDCPKCRLALHSCKQCTHFDPGRRFACTQPIPERVPDKSARNDCTYFSLRSTVERDTSGGAARPEDARRAFDNLFKR